ncbi:ImmA/IrrE family metallo-endopeptidase [Alicyclobacillus macrosporangiidus]|uniref:ImmA/IrrE family metallo-endopeptidase n=1 Tax=Alicyclobacillus macrosporangiidus TaxID=392015 RepID=UPI00054D36B3|nr:ImmA/IrrE family metallo-endopeptidase [Alicyclobacillus macrosporangiidus]
MLDIVISYVESFFRERNIWSPRDLCLDELAAEHNATLLYEPRRSHAVTIVHAPNSVEHLCVVNCTETRRVQRVHAAHELAHVLLHSGNQTTMVNLFRIYQEAQAVRLAGHIFAPTYLLAKYLRQAPPFYEANVTYLAHVFCVTYEAMQRRLEEFTQNYTAAGLAEAYDLECLI